MSASGPPLGNKPLTAAEYWLQTVRDPGWRSPREAMLQGNDAAEYDDAERLATLALLPSGRIGALGVELGCGIGRYTVDLARKVDVLHACDLVPESVALARASCAEHGLRDVFVEVADACEFLPARGLVDLIFLKWVLMYLDDARAERLIAQAAGALRAGGVLLVQDSCDPEADPGPNAAAEIHSPEYPARYRHPNWIDHRLIGAAKWREVRRADLGGVYKGWDYPPGAQPAWVLTRARD